MRVNTFERVKFLIIFLLVCILCLVIYFCVEYSPKNYLRVSFLDVGQGDAILFQTPHGGNILVDGGKDKIVLNKLGAELPIGTKNIELVVATHDDSDHIFGLIDVLKKYNVEVLLYPLPNSSSEISVELMKTAKLRNVKVVQVTKPMIIKTEDGLIVKVLFPIKNMDQEINNKQTEVNGNDASIVTQFIFGKTRILLTGDLPQTGEMFLVHKYGESLQSNILKLGHHGSDTSSNPEFLQAVKPDVAVVSAGKNNSFGHPHKSVLDLLEKFNIQVLRTDEVGTIHFYSNGLSVWRD